MTGIIILNWNGWQDTLDCVKSLMETNGEEFFLIIVDNGSSNDSIIQLRRLLGEVSDFKVYYMESISANAPSSISNKEIILLNAEYNYGFAKGNNIGLKIAKQYSPQYFMLLNNDTLVEPDFLRILVEFIETNSEYSALTPRIAYYSDPKLIWNCGGILKWGFRKYYYGNRPISEIKEKSHIDIEYITGCALFFKSDLIKSKNLLTERFFHGEEDIEFSYRMKKSGKKIACVLSSHILHKVGVSLGNKCSIGKIYVHYLNRFIDMRLLMTSLNYSLWKYVYFPYIAYLLHRLNFSWREICTFIKKLNYESRILDGVSKEKFLYHINNGLDK